MYKKISVLFLILALTLILISTVLFGSLLVHYYEYGPRFPRIQKFAIYLASIPINFEKILRYGNSLTPRKSNFEIKKNDSGDFIKFYKYSDLNRNELLILPRYEKDLQTSVVEIINLKNLEIIYKYNHDIDKTYKNLDKSRFSIKNQGRKRFQYGHPLIFEDGSLISKNVNFSPLFKTDICGNDLWVNDKYKFHHSLEIDHDKNVWVTGTLNKIDPTIYNNLSIIRDLRFGETERALFADDAIIKINPKTGKVIYVKSIISILFENNIFKDSDIFMSSDVIPADPIHVNDIEPVLEDSPFWKKGDLFISILRNSSILHYRPTTNEVINYIKGPFYEQHDIDILSNHEISIFNNNNSIVNDKKFSEILIYNFKTKKFKKILSKQLENKNFKTETEGLVDFLPDGSIMVEETNGGRILFFDNTGILEWEFANVAEDGKIYPISWARLISDVDLIKNIKQSINNKKCSN